MSVTLLKINNRNVEASKAVVDLCVSTAAELPAVDAFGTFTMESGSVALCLQTGAFYLLDGSTWYNADGSDAPQAQASVDDSRSVSLRNFEPLENVRFANPIEVDEDAETPAEDGEGE